MTAGERKDGVALRRRKIMSELEGGREREREMGGGGRDWLMKT